MSSNGITLLLIVVYVVYVTNKLKVWVGHTQGQHYDLIYFFLFRRFRKIAKSNS
jgi:hypothetical protein